MAVYYLGFVGIMEKWKLLQYYNRLYMGVIALRDLSTLEEQQSKHLRHVLIGG